MNRTPKVLVGNVQLTVGASTYYTAPANTTTTISAFTLNNTSGVPRTATVHLVPSGGTASAANQIATAIVIPASGAMPTILAGAIGQHLATGGSIQMFADANGAVSVYASGYESTP